MNRCCEALKAYSRCADESSVGAGEIKTVAKVEKETAGDKSEVVCTIKGGPGFDTPWLAIHAADITDLRDTLVDKVDVLIEVMKGSQAGRSLAPHIPPGGQPHAGGRAALLAA